MKEPRRSSAWSSRVRFSGASSGNAHRAWYRAFAEEYDRLYEPMRNAKAAAFLHALFHRHGGVHDVLDVACGTFGVDLGLANRGYRLVGRDLSPDMVRVAHGKMRKARARADVAVGDMRALDLGREFDAVLCLGTAFNYLTEPKDVRLAFRTFRTHLRHGGLLVLDVTNFDAWIDAPRNARTEVDDRARDGSRVAVFGFNDQSPAKTLHIARFLTVVQRGRRIDVRFDEAPLKVWSKETLARALPIHGFRPAEWYGDLAVGARYRRSKSTRLVAVATRL